MNTPGNRRSLFRLAAVSATAAMLLAACGDDEAEVGPEAGGSIAEDYDLEGAELTVGSKEFTEQLILGHMARLALQTAGAEVTDEIGLAGTAIVREALLAGEIDLYWEYTGTGWITHLGETEPVQPAEDQYQAVADRDLEENDIRWIEPGPFDNTYAVAAHESAVEELGITQLSDLQQLLEEQPEEATFCIASEFATRDDGLPGMEEHYDIEFSQDQLVMLDEGAIYSEVAERSNCNIGEVFATDGRIAALDLVVLEDDQDFFAAYNPSVTVRNEVYEQYPDLEPMFAEIAASLETEVMQELNARVDDLGEFPDEVAEDHLREQCFIG